MSVDEYYKSMGVVHTDKCEVCDIDPKPHVSHVKYLWRKGWFVWTLAVISFIAAYHAVTWWIYFLVSKI